MEQPSTEDEKLWQNVQIKFRLVASKFPDNKMFGIVNIEPESARRLIKEFELVVNNAQPVKFDSKYRTISASGFNTTNKKTFSAIIRAKPIKTGWTRKVESESCSFYFFDKVCTLGISVTFDWSVVDNKEGFQPSLVVEWRHIGDEKAYNYILYLDDKQIKHIHHRLIHDHLKIHIENLICGTEHTLEIAATLNNGKETCRSDPFEFTVPKEKPSNVHENEIIIILNEELPPNLPVFNLVNPEKEHETEGIERTQNKITTEDEGKIQVEIIDDSMTKNQLSSVQEEESNQFHLQAKHLLNLFKLQTESRNNHTETSCCPHETFLGINHYFSKDVNIHTMNNNNNSQNEL